METLEFALIVLACVIGSAVLCQVVRRASLPLVQIAVGAVVALLVPAVHDVAIPSELFLVLFIAPLLFDEARNTDPRELWENKGSILSLAVGLVLLTVLVVGFVLNWFVPSIPLAAAFACAAALAPTDAAAVGALASSVSLKRRQSTLLSGESLINDASGVVAFQFASAAALTGTFSALDAGGEFTRLFFGGIAVGAFVGVAGRASLRLLRRRGYENTTINVLYEVFSPFFVFLLAEWLHTSGILAVVAAGLTMAERSQRLTSTAAAQRQLVSNGFWRIIVFLVNSVVFVLLGMQLPQAFAPAIADHFSLPFVLAVVALVTALIVGWRFGWVLAMEGVYRLGRRRRRGRKLRKRPSRVETVQKNTPSPTPHLRRHRPHWRERIGSLLRNALTLTVGGPKGAVTLSIILTLPDILADGSPFPERDLIVFLTASVILCTLLLADLLLPRLAPRPAEQSSEDELHRATVRVLEGTLRELRVMLASDENAQYDPALRLTIARYGVRLACEREGASEDWRRKMGDLTHQVREARQQDEPIPYADEVDADALSIELDQIRHLQEHGEITLPIANQLRQRVYVLQMSLEE